jgi:hypothetical protein
MAILFILYYLFKITQLVQDHIGVGKRTDLAKRLRKDLQDCDYGEITFPM